MHSHVSEKHVGTKTCRSRKKRKRSPPPAGWRAYNEWSTGEIGQVYRLIPLVVAGITFYEPREAKGRKPIPWDVILTCLLVKVFRDLSYRRVIGEIELHKVTLGVEKVPHFNTLQQRMHDPYLAEVLERALDATEQLKELEDSQLVMDATGQAIRYGGRWIFVREKRRAYRRRDFRKTHVAVGLPSRMVAGAIGTRSRVHDSAVFDDLFEEVKDREPWEQGLFDSAYLSHKVCEKLAAENITPYIAKKSNTRLRPQPKDPFEKMVLFQTRFPNRFKSVFGQRWQEESVFAEEKRVIADRLRSRTWMAQKHEMDLIHLAYNIRCLTRPWIRVAG